MNLSQQYLTTLTGMFERMGMARAPVGVSVTLQKGKAWDKAEFVPGGNMGECFSNAMHLAMLNDWKYVEGWAVPGDLFPMEHAWCVKPDGTIVDATWEDGHDYFGVVFHKHFVYEVCVKTGYYGVFQDLYHFKQPVEQVQAMLLEGAEA